MDEKTFKSLKEGDRVVCKNGVAGTVEKVLYFGPIPMVKLKTDRRVYSCPYYYRSELKSLEKPLTNNQK